MLNIAYILLNQTRNTLYIIKFWVEVLKLAQKRGFEFGKGVALCGLNMVRVVAHRGYSREESLS